MSQGRLESRASRKRRAVEVALALLIASCGGRVGSSSIGDTGASGSGGSAGSAVAGRGASGGAGGGFAGSGNGGGVVGGAGGDFGGTVSGSAGAGGSGVTQCGNTLCGSDWICCDPDCGVCG